MSDYVKRRLAEIKSERGQREAVRRAAFERAVAERAPPPKPRKKPFLANGYVYFLRAANTVKIGFSINPRERLRSIQTGCPEDARIVKIVEGSMKTEKLFHERFAEYRLGGEWFDLRGRLAKYLEACLVPIDLPERVNRQNQTTEEIYL